MPFITEELWVSLTGGESLVVAKWPEADMSYLDKTAENLVTQMQAVITEVRRFRNDQGIKSSLKIPGRIIAKGDIAEYSSAVAFVVRMELGDITPSAKCEAAGVTIEFDLTGSIDVVAERARLEKDLLTATKDKQTAEVKLNNQGFMAKAPADVVIEIRERLEKTTADIERITAALAGLPQA